MSVSYTTHGAHYARFGGPDEGDEREYPEASEVNKKALDIGMIAAAAMEKWLEENGPQLGEYAFDIKTETVAAYIAETLIDNIGKGYRLAMKREG